MNKISSEVARQYMTQWEQLLNVSQNLSELFTNKGEVLYGFSIAYEQYVYLISRVGITEVRVFFGYDPMAVGFKFKIILWGTAGDKNLTEYYCCEDSDTITSPLPKDVGIDLSIPNMIPKVLAHTWTEAWGKLGSMPVEIFKTPFGNLRGYTFPIQDFFNVVMSFGPTDAVNIYFGDRIFGERKEDGNIGLLLVTKQMTSRGDGAGYGTFIDWAFPCPPTCPGL